MRLVRFGSFWDREDISLKVRSFPKADQRQLVDTFFRGKRLDLLGEPEPGPWMTSEEFFGPYLESGRLSATGRLSPVH
jgi:hypothetical protein